MSIDWDDPKWQNPLVHVGADGSFNNPNEASDD